MSKLLTIEDLRNPARKSGFEYVRFEQWPGRRKPYAAQDQRLVTDKATGRKRHAWSGPHRATAEEAAQDWCDYVNTGGGTMPTPRVRAPQPRHVRNLQRAHHARARKPSRPKLADTKRPKRPSKAKRKRAGFVYLIGIRRDASAVKVGWSKDDAFARLNELQTGNPLLLVGLAEFPGTLDDEYMLHCRYEADNILNEWFRPSAELVAEFDMSMTEFELAVDALDYVGAA